MTQFDSRFSTKEQSLRILALEKAMEFRDGYGTPDAVFLNTAASIEHYILTGEKLDSQLAAAYLEGATEARFEVKEAIEEWFSNVDLDDLFKARGWIDQKGMDNGSSAENGN